ncbi:hypothetical protein Micbo1qcDRAFT_176311 [Microdochium bolleyi]|uniref:Uncharacterized protein n=1 Tax=Microdochium bolleyi TaxID=196109 RepID=A0A136J0I3_9PEZI|nr:hypothetical protein Micbo1qcDRAFT_176311 [Microdochium bolleyi]
MDSERLPSSRTQSQRAAIEAAARRLLSTMESDANVRFFLETTPYSTGSGPACKLPACKDKIHHGDYRIAVYAGLSGRPSTAVLYHLTCFEELVNFEEPRYLDLLMPVTRMSFAARDLRLTSIMNGGWLLDGGAEKLALHWKDLMKTRQRKLRGQEDLPMSAGLRELLARAGSASFTPRKVPGMPDFEFSILSTILAPIESDGPGDITEWNLLHYYLSREFVAHPELVEDPPLLSAVLRKWETDCAIASKPLESLDKTEKAYRLGMSDKHIRGIKRLSAAIAPNTSAFL